MLSACTPKEELEWRSRLAENFHKDYNGVFDYPLFTSLFLEIKPLGTIFGKPGKTIQGYYKHLVHIVGKLYDKRLTYARHDCAPNFNSQSNDCRSEVIIMPGPHQEYNHLEGDCSVCFINKHE